MEQVDRKRGFAPIAEVLKTVSGDRFQRLRAWADRNAPRVAWDAAQLDALSLEHAAVVDAVHKDSAAAPATVFDAFTGSWVGGDPLDATRSYAHIWWPTCREGDHHVQRVLMRPLSGGEPTVAYNLCAHGGQISGVVDGRPYVGFSLSSDALVWIGEEGADAVSLHAERVVASGQLYEVRGWVLKVEAGDPSRIARSDWRYHRVSDGAVAPI